MERKLKTLTAKKETLFRRVQTLYTYSKNIHDPNSLRNFTIKYETLDKTIEEFSQTTNEINEVTITLDANAQLDFEPLNVVDELYCYIKSVAKAVFKSDSNLSESNPGSSNTNQTVQTKVRFPKIELKGFDGNIREFPVFIEMFNSLIHENEQLSDTEKVHYLVGKLAGKALNVCSGIPPVGANYSVIYQALIDKYSDKRYLANTYLYLFLDNFHAAAAAIQRLGLEDLSDFIISFLALSKLPADTAKAFEMLRCGKSSLPKYQEIVQFVQDQTKLLNRGKPSNLSKPKVTHSFTINKNSNPTKNNCVKCGNSHLLVNCSKFLKLSPNERFNFIKSKSLCILCLKSNHRVAQCQSKTNCRKCRFRHHSLLHFEKSSVSTENIEPPTNNSGEASPTTNDTNTSTSLHSLFSIKPEKFVVSPQHMTVLLSTVVVHVTDNFGRIQRVRFLLDGGSQSNFLSTSCGKRLGLSTSKTHLSVQGIGSCSKPIHSRAKLIFSSRFDNNQKYSIEVFIIDKITENLPSSQIDTANLEHLSDLPLADDTYHQPGEIDGILGADVLGSLLRSGKVKGNTNSPVAIQTSLGYIVMGSVPTVENCASTNAFCTFHSLEDLVHQFWSLEDVPSPAFLNEEDAECEKIFSASYSRDAITGRYMVPLPFHTNPDQLGNSYEVARRRFLSLEKKLEASPSFRVAYNEVMQDYLDQNHMSLVPNDNIKDKSYFIAHHGVFKPGSTSTPLRVVFDAGMKTDNLVSLNDLLYCGPKLQTDLLSLLLNFRLFPVALTADIRQMYRQILILEEHRKYQRLLWRFSPEMPLSIYQINTVCFGVKSSPFLALRTVQQLAQDEKHRFPFAALLASNNFYVDDFICSVENEEMAVKAYNELVALFKAGAFDLVKWVSNSADVMRQIPDSEKITESLNFDSNFKVLGLEWFAAQDSFSFKLGEFDNRCTKRNVLSVIAQIFDVIGFIVPVLMFAKLLLREFWKLKIDWDQSPSRSLEKMWLAFHTELKLLSNFKIPRHLLVFKNMSVSIIGMCDSSEKGYGALIYFRTHNDNGVNCSLVCAKSKVAPLKSLSIPRLELCAALLLSKLLRFVLNTYSNKVNITRIVALSDSTVVLNWIKSSPHRWKTFVANRVAKIQSNIAVEHWWHIPGQFNPCDCLSRGMFPSEFLSKSDWLAGPSWLSLEESQWPIKKIEEFNVSCPEEKTVSLPVTRGVVSPIYEMIHRFSSWKKLVFSVVYVLRFLKIVPLRNSMEPADIDVADHYLLKAVQFVHFSNEIQLLDKGNNCSPYLRKLRPFMKNGILRVGGRLSNANIEYDHQHPILLPQHDHFVNLLVDYYHQQNLHTGPSLLLSLLRQKYWILSARNIVRKRIHSCNFCFRHRPQAVFPLMGDLPTPRVNLTKAFLHTATDYCGPFRITMSRHRGVRSQKAYVCLFICLCTKAVHLELSSDLSTDCLMNTLKRFLARRGPCSHFYSDCGSNYLGAKSELRELYKLIESSDYSDSLKQELLRHKITWKLNPPRTPHFGGLHESNIKSCKTLLSKVIGAQILSYEEFSTVLTQVEALLNSRPLYVSNSDPGDPEALCPAHFLTLTPLQSLPSIDVTSQPTHLLRRKILLDQLVQSYWKRWHIEYLSSFQMRQKWNTPALTVKPGMVVVIIVENIPPLQWPLGVIEEVFPGSDGGVRVATVRTKGKVYKRPVVKLCPLPTQ